MARTPDGAVTRDKFLHVRLTPTDEAALNRQRGLRGGMSASAYVRWLITQDGKRIEREKGQ
jgi:hypothetical protein